MTDQLYDKNSRPVICFGKIGAILSGIEFR